MRPSSSKRSRSVRGSPTNDRKARPTNVTASAVQAFLRTNELDSLVHLREGIDAAARNDAEPLIREVIARWNDRQALANLLMHAGLIPADLRVAALVRGLRAADEDYLRLAATVGVGETGNIDAAQRTALVESLLDVISTAGDPQPSGQQPRSVHSSIRRRHPTSSSYYAIRNPSCGTTSRSPWYVNWATAACQTCSPTAPP